MVFQRVKKLSPPYSTAYIIFILTYAYIFIPPLWLFLSGVESGMNHIDRIYPYTQSRAPLHENPVLIYTHMYSNIVALGLQLALLILHPPTISCKLHGRLAWTYATLVVVGTTASIVYASHQKYGNDGGKAGTFAFGVMAMVTFYSLFTTLYYGQWRRNATLHREWAIRTFAVLFGNGVFFRVLANTYLVWMPRWGADFYASWCQMIYLSWVLPLLTAELYLGWEREKGRNGAEVRIEEKGETRDHGAEKT